MEITVHDNPLPRIVDIPLQHPWRIHKNNNLFVTIQSSGCNYYLEVNGIRLDICFQSTKLKYLATCIGIGIVILVLKHHSSGPCDVGSKHHLSKNHHDRRSFVSRHFHLCEGILKRHFIWTKRIDIYIYIHIQSKYWWIYLAMDI